MNYKYSTFYQLAFISLIFIGVYYPSIFAPFNSIDDNKMIDSLLNLDTFSIQQILIPKNYGQYYRPLLYLTFIADKYIWGLEASFMHLENILLHTANSLLVYQITRLVISTAGYIKSHSYMPVTAALLFGLHPIATEPVNWISGRTDLLSGFFVLLALLLFLQSRKSISYWYGIAGALSLLAGCLSKETALFILPVILAWCVFSPKENNVGWATSSCLKLPHVHDSAMNTLPLRLRLFHFFTYSSAGSVYLLMRWLALSGGDKIVKTVAKVGGASASSASTDMFILLRVVSKTAGFYFKKLLIPVPLNFGINAISPQYFWLGLVVLCGVIWCLYRRDTISYLFLAAFMLTSSAFVLPILKITWTPIAERYVYMASAPFLISTTLMYSKHFSNLFSARASIVLVALILGCFAFATVKRNIIWQDNLTLFEDTLKKSPDFGVIKNEYAIALRDKGRIKEADSIMLSNTVDEFQPSSLNNIKVMANKGELKKARLLLLERLNKDSEYKNLSYELLLNIDELRRDKAKYDNEKALIDKDLINDLKALLLITEDPFYHYRLGKVQLRLDDKVSAKVSFTKAWQGASPKSHYREAAKKLSERL